MLLCEFYERRGVASQWGTLYLEAYPLTGTLAAHSGHVPRMVSHVERSGSKKGDSGAIDLLFVRTDLWALSLSYRLVHESTARGMLSNRHRESPVKHLIYGLSSM